MTWWYTRLKASALPGSRLFARLVGYAYHLIHDVIGGRRGALAQLAELKDRVGRECVPLDRLVEIKASYPSVPHSLTNHPYMRVGTGRDLTIAPLKQLLHDHELGIWTLSVDVIEHVHQWVLEHQPAKVLEFSSGVSTVVLADAMSRYMSVPDVTPIMSIEQDVDCAQKTMAILKQAGLEKWATVHHVPVGQTDYAEAPCYNLPDSGLMTELRGEYGLILIDGPSCSRRATLPMACQLVTVPCPFMLDDALRDDEIEDLRAWSKRSDVQLKGVRLIGKGLAEGIVEPAAES